MFMVVYNRDASGKLANHEFGPVRYASPLLRNRSPKTSGCWRFGSIGGPSNPGACPCAGWLCALTLHASSCALSWPNKSRREIWRPIGTLPCISSNGSAVLEAAVTAACRPFWRAASSRSRANFRLWPAIEAHSRITWALMFRVSDVELGGGSEKTQRP